MFRFSVRDLLWLTLVVAVGLGWLVRERRIRAEVQTCQIQIDIARDEARRWRGAAGALEYAMSEDGWRIDWNLRASEVRVSPERDRQRTRCETLYNTAATEPSGE